MLHSLPLEISCCAAEIILAIFSGQDNSCLLKTLAATSRSAAAQCRGKNRFHDCGVWRKYSSTKVAAVGRYVTWRALMGPDAVGKPVAVWMATKGADGRWTAFARVTSRVADAAGVVTYSRRETTTAWVSVRLVFDTITSTAVQARWR